MLSDATKDTYKERDLLGYLKFMFRRSFLESQHRFKEGYEQQDLAQENRGCHQECIKEVNEILREPQVVKKHKQWNTNCPHDSEHIDQYDDFLCPMSLIIQFRIATTTVASTMESRNVIGMVRYPTD